MPTPTFQSPSGTPPDPAASSPFMQRLILFLLPYFLTVTPDFDVARAEILETLQSYGARTRAEMLNATQIIAFGFTALDVLAEAKVSEDMAPAMRLRFRGCANNLSRSGQQNEQVLARRLACDVPQPTEQPAEPVDDLNEAAFQEALQNARAQIAGFRQSLADAHAVMPPQAESQRYDAIRP